MTILTVLFSPVGRVLLIGLALFSLFALADRRATYRERARCEAAKIQSKLDAANADLAIAKRRQADAESKAGELEREKTEAEHENQKLAERIKALPLGEQCILDRRLR